MTFYPTAVLREIHGEPEKAARLTRMLEIEDEVFQTAAGILGAALDFCHVAPDQQEPPPDWVSRFGEEGAKQRLAVAKAGWMPPSLAPASLKLAAQMYTGIARIRGMAARGASGPREVNAKIALPAPKGAGMPGAPEYPSKEVE
jgi:hypothetical protein